MPAKSGAQKRQAPTGTGDEQSDYTENPLGPEAKGLNSHARTSVAHTYFAASDYERALFWYGTRVWYGTREGYYPSAPGEWRLRRLNRFSRMSTQ